MKRVVSTRSAASRNRRAGGPAMPVSEDVLSEKLSTEFRQFIEYHSAKRFSKNLRKMLLEFLMHDGSIESIYLKDLLYDMDGLFDLLDAMESEAETSDA